MRIIGVIIFISICLFNPLYGQTNYQFKVDLNAIQNDKLKVELQTPNLPKGVKTIKYHLPKIVPGTYSIYDFGRFVSKFKALTKSGKELKVKRPDSNTWLIEKAHKMDKIIYTVEDTWDTDKDNKVFEPGGTNFERGKNFVFNNHGLFGYFEEMKQLSYEITIDRPAKLQGATSLKHKAVDEDTDIYLAENYMDLVDGPIMFSEPDFTTLNIGNAKVLVSVYSPNKKVSSAFIAGEVEAILEAQRAYLGGQLPVDFYAFIIYLTDGYSNSGGYGALEHSYSSVYYLPETEPEGIAQTIRDVAAHEFFHIVTPLNIHSEEIHDFDFINPKMSQHLWLYEGVTEYSAGHVQVKYGLMPIEDYLDVIAEKIRGAEQHKQDLSFTKMSSGCLHEHKDQYLNVYQKGALIGMCMDIKLRTLSQGKYGMQELMHDLSKEYGKNKAFKDSELFAKIEELTYPEIGDFLKMHVAGTKPLPIKELLAEAGVEYAATKMKKEKTLGGLENALGFDYKTMSFLMEDATKLEDFGKTIGFKNGDLIKAWNGKPLTSQNINQVITDFMINVEEDDDFTIQIERDKEEMELKATYQLADVEVKHAFSLIEAPSKAQTALRKAWLGEYIQKEDLEEK